MNRLFIRAALPLILLTLTACGGTNSPSAAPSGGSAAVPASFNQFSDIPIPAKANMDMDQSLLLGQGDGWVGRLVYSTGTSQGQLYDLYRSGMPGFGWQEVISVRSSISVQTWQRGERVATVQIRDGFFGSEVTVTVAPSPSAAGGPAGMAPPAPMGAPATAVSRQPLR